MLVTFKRRSTLGLANFKLKIFMFVIGLDVCYNPILAVNLKWIHSRPTLTLISKRKYKSQHAGWKCDSTTEIVFEIVAHLNIRFYLQTDNQRYYAYGQLL